jgi:superfamily II DNA or RNA helicase
MCHQTFNKIYDQINGKIELMLMDEAHHIPETRVKQINLWKGRFVVGLTATAIRKEF